MTNTAAAHINDFWDFDFAAPQPTQDAELLRQLQFVPGLKEILMVRQVHALEHATVWVLSEGNTANTTKNSATTMNSDNSSLGGLSTDKGFYLYGQVVNLAELKRAVSIALQRLTSGEWDLAVHPRCGTNLSVGMFLTASLTLATHLILPRGPIEQILGISLAAVTATQLAPDLGSLVQKYLTTAIPFNLAIIDIESTTDFWGNPSYFVKVCWQD
ncbi:MAG: hypothetical protein F6K58_15330 [Symploca sp. SIO2E9]|nr:hypothetical protein [Symploca sp. SIO2E9]